MYALVVDDRRSPHKIYNQPNYRVHVYNRVLGAGAYAISLIRMRSADTLSRILIIISLIRVAQLVARWPLNSVRSHELIRSEMRWKISANRKINVKFPICIYFMQVSWVDAVEAMTFSSVLCSRWNFFFCHANRWRRWPCADEHEEINLFHFFAIFAQLNATNAVALVP